jgi:hypothetical protein
MFYRATFPTNGVQTLLLLLDANVMSSDTSKAIADLQMPRFGL